MNFTGSFGTRNTGIGRRRRRRGISPGRRNTKGRLRKLAFGRERRKVIGILVVAGGLDPMNVNLWIRKAGTGRRRRSTSLGRRNTRFRRGRVGKLAFGRGRRKIVGILVGAGGLGPINVNLWIRKAGIGRGTRKKSTSLGRRNFRFGRGRLGKFAFGRGRRKIIGILIVAGGLGPINVSLWIRRAGIGRGRGRRRSSLDGRNTRLGRWRDRKFSFGRGKKKIVGILVVAGGLGPINVSLWIRKVGIGRQRRRWSIGGRNIRFGRCRAALFVFKRD